MLEYCQNPAVRGDDVSFDVDALRKQRRDVRPPEPFESWFEVDEVEEEAEDESAAEHEESPHPQQADGRLDRALEYARLNRRRPEELPPVDIQNAIVQVLQKCPNHTCTLKSLTSRVLKELGVLSRGNPRLEFENRVMRNLGALKRKRLIEEYKAKNRRIRFLSEEESPYDALKS